jgi:multidrug resistance efflux pump
VRVRAEHAETRSIVEADVLNRKSEWEAEDRAFTNDTVQIQLAIAELRTSLEADRHLARGLQRERDQLKAAADLGVASRLEEERVSAAYEVAASRIATSERHLEQAEAEYRRALERREAYDQRRPAMPSVRLADQHVERAVDAQQALLAELEALRDQHVLRAPCDGVVVDLQGRAGDELTRRPGEMVLREPGESLAAGEPVLAIAETQPSEIVAYLGERQWNEMTPGTEIVVAAMSRPSVRHATRVRSVHPTIERLPERLWPAPNVPAWGRPVLIEVPAGLELLPGELVHGRPR